MSMNHLKSLQAVSVNKLYYGNYRNYSTRNTKNEK